MCPSLQPEPPGWLTRPNQLAKAGFFFEPHPKSPDNVVCFLCDKSLDGWEENDNPLEEHLKHSPTCGWAIVAAIEAGFGNYGKVHPLDPAMVEARKATFGGRWPYESKKGFKCKTKKVGRHPLVGQVWIATLTRRRSLLKGAGSTLPRPRPMT
jgi:hypothetical protein